MKKLLVVLAVLALSACSQPTAPAAAKSAPTQVSQSRWILISGEAPRPGCTDTGDGFQSCP